MTRERAKYAVELDDKASPIAKKVETSFRNLGSGVAALEGPLGGTAGRISTLNALVARSGGLLAIFGVSIAGVALGLGEALKASAALERQEMRTQAQLKATGNVVGFTARQLTEMADELDRRTLASAEGARDAQAVLLSFRTIRGSEFERTLKIAQDMAAVFGTDLRSAAIQLGKALEDPKTGLNSLRRSGVSFTDSQKDMIQALMEAGDQVKAQQLILAELEAQVGGAGEGEAQGLTGALDGLSFEWTKLMQALGDTGPITVATSVINTLKESIEGWRKAIAKPSAQSNFNALLAEQIELQEQIQDIGSNEFLQDETLRISMLSEAGAKLAKVTLELNRMRAVREAEDRRIGAGFNAPRPVPEEDETKKKTARGRKSMTADDKFFEGLEHTKRAIAEEARELEKALAPAKRMAEARAQLIKGLETEVELLGKGRVARELKTLSDLKATPEELKTAERLAKRIELYDQEQKKIQEAKDAVRDLGLAFTSAFEDAVVNGNDLRSVLSGLLQDLGRLVVRENVTKPFAQAFNSSGIVDSIGGFFSGIFGGFKAQGGPVKSGRAYVVGERGPELFLPPSSGAILPNGVGGVTLVQHVNVDARGADAGVEARIRQAMQETERRTIRRLKAEIVRGGPAQKLMGAR